MNPLALILPCLALLFLGCLLFRGLLIWWDMLGGLWNSPLPFSTRATVWVTFVLLTVGLLVVDLIMNRLLLFILP